MTANFKLPCQCDELKNLLIASTVTIGYLKTLNSNKEKRLLFASTVTIGYWVTLDYHLSAWSLKNFKLPKL